MCDNNTPDRPLIHEAHGLCEKCKTAMSQDIPLAYCVHHKVLLLARFDSRRNVIGYRAVEHVPSAEQAEALVRRAYVMLSEQRAAA